MTLTNTVVAKLAVAFVAISMVFALVAPAQAQTADELQATIDSLMAQIAALNTQLGTGSTGGSSAGVCPYTWTRSLNQGATGADVMALQQFLNASADTQVSVSGAGAPGSETSYYGPATAAAVSNFQVKYRTDILSPVGLVNPTGYFGPSTMAKANMLCTSAPVMDDTMDDTMDDDASDDDDSNSGLSGGEADVNSFDFSDEEDEVEEGSEDVPVLNIEFDVEDGDVSLERIDINFNRANIGGTAENEPWEVFDEISIWVDGDKVASEDATDEDDWDEDDDDFEFRLTNVDEIFREDTTGEVIVAVSVQGGVDVDATGSNNEWMVNIPANGMRFVDSLGLDITAPSTAGAASTFEIQEEGANDDLDLESSDSDPDASTFALDEDDEMEYMIFAFDLSAEDSDGDVTLDNFVSINVCVGGTDGTSLNAIVDDFRIEIDGDSYDAESYTGTATCVNDIDFDVDGDTTIEADETVTVEVYAIFNDVSNTFATATIQATTSPAQIDAEGGDDITVGGSDVEGETHTVRLDGVDVSLVSEDTDLIVNDDTDPADDEGEFTIEFDVTAFGDDVFIPFGAATATDLTAGFEYSILDNNNAVVDLTGATLTVSVDVDDSSAEKNNTYKVAEGSTERFTLTVQYDPATSGAYKLRLDTVNFDADDDDGTATTAQDVSDQDIDTSKLTI